MDGLPLFRPTCLYCFTSLADELLLCECSAVICSKHSILHSNKKECTLLASLKIMADSSLAIHPYNNKINIPKLKQTILDRIKILEQDLKECHHPTKSLPSQTIIPESTSCSICSINDNLWICSECGHIGCGREQHNSVGNSHALYHFNSTGHSLAIPIKCMTRAGSVQSYCYLCDEYVINPYKLNFIAEAQECVNTQECANTQELRVNTQVRVDVDVSAGVPGYVGIVNIGETCYIASTLQLLAQAFADYSGELEQHYELCFDEPLECFCCQFVKIMISLISMNQKINQINISDFIGMVFMQMPALERGVQQDSADFIELLLEKLRFYEDSMLLPKITNKLEFKSIRNIRCNKCNINDRYENSDMIFYLGYADFIGKSFMNYFKDEITGCECGGEKEISTRINKIPEKILAVIKRHKIEDGKIEKINEKIEIKKLEREWFKVEENNCEEWELRSSICHVGLSAATGHYKCWIKKDGESYMISDTEVNKSTDLEAFNGTVFLFDQIDN